MQRSGKECVKVRASTSKVAQLSGILGSFIVFVHVSIEMFRSGPKRFGSGMFDNPMVNLGGVHCINRLSAVDANWRHPSGSDLTR